MELSGPPSPSLTGLQTLNTDSTSATSFSPKVSITLPEDKPQLFSGVPSKHERARFFRQRSSLFAVLSICQKKEVSPPVQPRVSISERKISVMSDTARSATLGFNNAQSEAEQFAQVKDAVKEELPEFEKIAEDAKVKIKDAMRNFLKEPLSLKKTSDTEELLHTATCIYVRTMEEMFGLRQRQYTAYYSVNKLAPDIVSKQIADAIDAFHPPAMKEVSRLKKYAALCEKLKMPSSLINKIKDKVKEIHTNAEGKATSLDTQYDTRLKNLCNRNKQDIRNVFNGEAEKVTADFVRFLKKQTTAFTDLIGREYTTVSFPEQTTGNSLGSFADTLFDSVKNRYDYTEKPNGRALDTFMDKVDGIIADRQKIIMGRQEFDPKDYPDLFS